MAILLFQNLKLIFRRKFCLDNCDARLKTPRDEIR
jgi:hypothetical protein